MYNTAVGAIGWSN